MCRRFKRLTDRYDSITIPDYLESRLRDTGHRIRLVAAFTLVVFVTIYVSAQIDAIGTAFEAFLGWNYYIGALVGFAVVLVYIVSGGFRGGGLVRRLSGHADGRRPGGAADLRSRGRRRWLDESDRACASRIRSCCHCGGRRTGWTSLFSILGFLAIGLGFLGSPQIFVRFLSLRSVKEIRPGAIVAICWTLLADTGAVLVGMVGRPC